MDLPNAVTSLLHNPFKEHHEIIPGLHAVVAKDPVLAKLRAREGAYTLLHKCVDIDSSRC